ncbi:MAG: sulfite exporter TauE/SafE family protein [Pseudomonadota bacterium]
MEQTLALIFGAFFISAFLKGITGLGFSTICLALLASVVDLKLAIPMVLIPSLGSNILVMRQAGHFRATLSEFKWLYIAALPGLIAGLALLGSLRSASTAAVLGAVLVVYAVFALANPTFELRASLKRTLQIPTGVLTGLINGATGSQVMPVLPFLMSVGLPPERFVQAINISFTASSLVMMSGLIYLGLLDWTKALTSAGGLIPVYVGIKLGGRLRRRLPERGFRIAVLVMLIALGLNLLRAWAVST